MAGIVSYAVAVFSLCAKSLGMLIRYAFFRWRFCRENYETEEAESALYFAGLIVGKSGLLCGCSKMCAT